MRVSTMTYILKQGFKNIWRNIRFSLASIATMAACIFLFGIFLSLVMNFRYMVHSAEEGVAVVVYFDEGVKQEQIDNIGSKIKKNVGSRTCRVCICRPGHGKHFGMNTLVVMTHLQKDSVTRIILWQIQRVIRFI